jgi:hypothetical protein
LRDARAARDKVAEGGKPVMISARFFNFVAQDAHFFTTAFITFVMAVFFRKRGEWIAAVGGVLYAAFHEFWYDPRYENAATRGSDVQDFCFLVLGVLFAVLLYHLVEKYHLEAKT